MDQGEGRQNCFQDNDQEEQEKVQQKGRLEGDGVIHHAQRRGQAGEEADRGCASRLGPGPGGGLDQGPGRCRRLARDKLGVSRRHHEVDSWAHPVANSILRDRGSMAGWGCFGGVVLYFGSVAVVCRWVWPAGFVFLGGVGKGARSKGARRWFWEAQPTKRAYFNHLPRMHWDSRGSGVVHCIA